MGPKHDLLQLKKDVFGAGCHKWKLITRLAMYGVTIILNVFGKHDLRN